MVMRSFMCGILVCKTLRLCVVIRIVALLVLVVCETDTLKKEIICPIYIYIIYVTEEQRGIMREMVLACDVCV